MEEELFRGEDGIGSSVGDAGAAAGTRASGRNAISFGSQMLAVGAGFCVFIMLLALFAAVQHRKRRRGSSLRSPLITKSASYGRQPSQAIPPPPQYLRCSNQNLRKCSSPGGSDYSLSSAYSSSGAGSAHSLSPMSPYGHHQQLIGGGGYNNLPQPPLGTGPFAGVNFIPYGTTAVPNGTAEANCKRRSFTASMGLMGGGGVPQLLVDGNGRGSISLQLAYDPNNLALQITVIACNGLPKFAGANACPLNPYIKLRLLPEGQHRVKTRILRDTQDPIFDEAFTMYGLGVDTLRSCQLHLAALAFDRYNGDTVLGEAVHELTDLPVVGGEPQNLSLKWEARAPFEGQKRGKALASVAFEPGSRLVKFALWKMADLPQDQTLGLLDPYAKLYALVNGQRRVAKHKTRVLKRTQAPQFGPEDWLEFTLPDSVGFDRNGVPSALSFQVILFNHDGVKRNEPIGQFTVDAESEQFMAAFQQQQQEEGGIGNSDEAEWHTIHPF